MKLMYLKSSVFILSVFFSERSLFALTATNTFNVSATVTDVCTVTATPMAFGNYASGGATISTTNTVSVTCNTGTGYFVDLNSGLNSTNFTPRKMNNGVNLLDYNIYTDLGHTSIWGDGTNSTVRVQGTGNGAAQSITAYGNIPAAQSLPGGAYNDTIIVTVNYS